MGYTRLDCTSPAFAELSADLLHAGIALRFTAQGSSMKPMLRSGDILMVKPVEISQVKVGDVVLCSISAGRVVAHRVIRRRTDKKGLRFLVQGDQVGKPDGWITQEQVHGQVESLERSGRQVNLKTPAARLLGILQAIKLRWHLNRLGFGELIGRLIKQLPCLSEYLT